MPIILLRMTSERHFFVALSFRGERREEGGGTNEKSGMLFYREKRGESYPREITRLTQLNSNQLWRELERMMS